MHDIETDRGRNEPKMKRDTEGEGGGGTERDIKMTYLSVSVSKRAFLIQNLFLFNNIRYQENVSTSVNDIQQVVVDVFRNTVLPKTEILYSIYATMSESI